jgi:hypothetical protein
MSGIAAETAVERITGGTPSRLRALTTAAVAGVAAAVLVYKVLRSGDDSQEE